MCNDGISFQILSRDINRDVDRFHTEMMIAFDFDNCQYEKVLDFNRYSPPDGIYPSHSKTQIVSTTPVSSICQSEIHFEIVAKHTNSKPAYTQNVYTYRYAYEIYEHKHTSNTHIQSTHANEKQKRTSEQIENRNFIHYTK